MVHSDELEGTHAFLEGGTLLSAPRSPSLEDIGCYGLARRARERRKNGLARRRDVPIRTYPSTGCPRCVPNNMSLGFPT